MFLMAKSKKVNEDRRVKEDRRSKDEAKADRRQKSVEVASDARTSDRRKTPRRRQIDPTTCERDYSNEEIEFMHALDEYKRASGRMFPTCSEILEVIHKLGYQRDGVAPTISAVDGPQNEEDETSTEELSEEPVSLC